VRYCKARWTNKILHSKAKLYSNQILILSFENVLLALFEFFKASNYFLVPWSYFFTAQKIHTKYYPNKETQFANKITLCLFNYLEIKSSYKMKALEETLLVKKRQRSDITNEMTFVRICHASC
jgi:hypothetical protein